MEVPLVSICCISYNHGKIIRDCIEGFLMQKASFKYEILIHDDASTDETIEIIKFYEEKHPTLIKSIIQIENQYSKGLRGINIKFNFPRAKGKYIALCEGDDYWTDPLKLQRQVDILEQNENISACFTNAEYINELDNTRKDYITNLNEGVVAPQQIFEIGGSIYPTASLLFKSSDLNYKIFHEIPEMAGDEALIYSLVMQGEVYYLNKKTCAYRRWSGGIYSSISKNIDKLVIHKAKDIVAYTKFDKTTDYKFTSHLKKRIRANSLFIIINGSQIKVKLDHIKYLNKSDYWSLFKRLLSKYK